MRLFPVVALLLSTLLIGPAAASGSPAPAPPGSAASPGLLLGEHRLRTTDGIELWYRVAGKETGLPVVFLHGGPGEGSQVMQALGGPALERRVRMVYLDQRGSGRSDRPKEAAFYSMRLLEGDIETLRRSLGTGKIVLLAHSAGTPIALNYAASHPQHVAGLILTGAVPDFPAAVDHLCARIEAVRPDLYSKARAAASPGRRCDPFAAFSGGDPQPFFDGNMFPDRKVRDRVNWLDRIPGLANSGELGGALFQQGLLSTKFEQAERITMPLLFIAGARDRQAPLAPQRALASKVRDGTVKVYPHAGHFMFAEEPERFARDVSSFVRRATRRG